MSAFTGRIHTVLECFRRSVTTHPSTRVAACAGSVLATVAAQAPAGTPPDGFSESHWEEIVVVANKVPRPAREVGSAVTVLTEQDIDIREVDLGAELLREVPGVAVNRAGQVGNVTQARIRGAEGNHTLVLVDGIEANDPAFGSEFDFANLLTHDIGRVEVLRGPQSALYGSDAIGGVVSVSSRTPEPGLQAGLEAQGGSFGTRAVGGTVSRGAEHASGLLSAMRYETDGISASAIQPEKDGYDNTTLHGKLDLEPVPQLDARVVLRHVDSTVETDREDFSFPAGPTQGLVVDADDETRSSQLYGLVELEASLLDGRWLHRAAYGHTETERDIFESSARVSESRGERGKLEYQSTLRFGDGGTEHALTGAVQHEMLDFEQRSVVNPGANQRQDDAQTSYVGEYALGLADRASLSLSVRHDDNREFADATTVRATTSYLFAGPRTRLHASYGEGITNPGFFELYGFIPASFTGNSDLEPEQSHSWDTGVEQSLLGGRALVDVTYFDATLEEEIAVVYDPATLTSSPVNQAGRSDREGVEVTIQAQLLEALTVNGVYTYLDAVEADGRREVRRPRHTASVNVDYRLLDGRANVNLAVIHNGEQEDAEFVSATPRTRVTLDDYTLVNLAARVDVTEHVELFVRGDNLLDSDYQEVYGYRSPGIAGYLGVRASL